MASGARLLRYATGATTTGSKLRERQSDQEGGTSLPDTIRALIKGHGWNPAWASPDDGPRPPGRVAQSISLTKLDALLAEGHMVILQGNYNVMSRKFREQASPLKGGGGHALTIDAVDPARGYYVVDTIPRKGKYEGRWIPAAEIQRYATGLAGAGQAWAAWARPANVTTGPTTPTPESGRSRGLAFSILSERRGIATVQGPKHALIRTWDNHHVAIAEGARKVVLAECRLDEPLDHHPGDRQPVYLVSHPEQPVGGAAFFLLAVDCTVEWNEPAGGG
jgi:hypothetical protein